MRLRQTVVPGASVTRLLGVALLASSAAACSSDASRFSHQSADQFYTASVPQPASDSLAPVGANPRNPVPPGGVGPSGGSQGGYPQASAYPASNSFPQAPAPASTQQAGVSQAFPGDYRAPLQQGYDPASTGSVPGAARAAASSASLVPQQVRRSALNAGDGSPSFAPSRPAAIRQDQAASNQIRHVPEPVKAPQSVVASVPDRQPFPERSEVTGSIQPASIYNADADQVLAPDPIVTGTAPKGAGWTTTGATRIALGPGETIYNLSKRYGVPAAEIMKANDIDDASKVAAGRQLLIPVYVYSRQAPVSAPDNNPRTRASNSGVGLQGEARHNRIPVPLPAPSRDVAVLPAAPSVRSEGNSQGPVVTAAVTERNRDTAPAAPKGGIHTVKAGDTLSKIARTHGVGVDALKAANSLSGSTIRIGQTLAIPGESANSVDTTRTASVTRESEPRSYTPPAPQANAGVAQDGVADKARGEVAAVAPAATGIDKFRWPARGQVITGFARTEDGKRNDGIDISMPTGTPIKAAENGVVIYSGDGLKEYGKTVLIRHDDGLVTVYAHANDLHVKRGDKIARGQVIASSGMSGVAKTPRLHFEVRKNAAPVDPMTYLE
ncbi:MAG: peptidoglycan DD-metalloendopeptidase family protein [Hoeflea sp.]|uniref:peptidoglycan DD-metalloendopeptidase family protein n=1 Tax=Hoeflea sp. TaxID=1940281 RepID=UPI0032F05B74